MLRNFDNNLHADLRKKSSIKDEIKFSKYNIQSCMVVLAVMLVLLFSVISIVTAQNPNIY